eukprot:4903923-Prymnesium_polylepis.2
MLRPTAVATLACVAAVASSARSVTTLTSGHDDDDVPYNEKLFLGTHNSAINLGASTVARPSAAVGGAHTSEAHSAYQYTVMDQRLSVLDQLDQGVRVLDFEMAALSDDWRCDDADRSGGARCEEHVRLSGRCFSGCPFIVSHGTVKQSISLRQGFTFPETLFESVAAFVAAHPDEIVTLLLIASHGAAVIMACPPCPRLQPRLRARGADAVPLAPPGADPTHACRARVSRTQATPRRRRRTSPPA